MLGPKMSSILWYLYCISICLFIHFYCVLYTECPLIEFPLYTHIIYTHICVLDIHVHTLQNMIIIIHLVVNISACYASSFMIHECTFHYVSMFRLFISLFSLPFSNPLFSLLSLSILSLLSLSHSPSLSLPRVY